MCVLLLVHVVMMMMMVMMMMVVVMVMMVCVAQGSELLYDLEVPGPPAVLELYNKDGGKPAPHPRQLT